MVKSCIRGLCTNPLGIPPPSDPTPKECENHINNARNMLYLGWMVTLSGHNVKKKVSETSIFELPRAKNCISRLCTGTLGTPPPPGPNTQIK